MMTCHKVTHLHSINKNHSGDNYYQIQQRLENKNVYSVLYQDSKDKKSKV